MGGGRPKSTKGKARDQDQTAEGGAYSGRLELDGAWFYAGAWPVGEGVAYQKSRA